MGRGLLDPGSPGHGIALEASDLLGMDVVRLSTDAPEDELRATEVAQPLLLLHSVALLRLVEPRLVATAVAGHSLGEFTALVASGALTWQQALALVRERGLAMAEACSAVAADERQGMSAVLAMDGPEVSAAVAGLAGPGEVLVVANENAPGQVVISGHIAVLERAAERLRAAGARRVMPLQVGGAFHSPLMAAAAERLGAALDAAPLAPGLPQAFNVDGRIRIQPTEVRAALREQLTSAVRWTACIRTLVEVGVQRFVELGPGSTLSALGRRIDGEREWLAVSDASGAAALTA